MSIFKKYSVFTVICVDLSQFLTSSLTFTDLLRFRNDNFIVKALFTRDILAHNIAIKRYWDKNIFLSHGYLKGKVTS